MAFTAPSNSSSASASSKWVKITKGNYEICTLSRVSARDPVQSSMESPAPDLSLILERFFIVGAVGVVFRSDAGMIVKFSLPTKEAYDRLYHEATVYTHLSNKSTISTTPTFHGLFECDGRLAIIVSDEGESLSSFHSLSISQRTSLYTDLVMLHEAGVYHGDFAARNVVQRSRGTNPKIIDYSHAELGHDCPGPATCKELSDAFKDLCHPDDS